MYTAILMTALTATSTSPNFHRGYGCSCHGGYPYSYNPGCYGCYGYGMPAGHGFHGPHDPGYGYGASCYGCYGGYSCYGIPLPGAPTAPRPAVNQPPRDPYPPINPAPKKETAPVNDSAEEVAVPKAKKDAEKKPAEPEKKPVEQKKLGLEPSTPLRAKISIEVPEGGKLFVDDHAIKAPAGTRQFQTPPLAPGERYFYDIRIECAGEIRSRRVVIEPGHDVAVSFPAMTPSARVGR